MAAGVAAGMRVIGLRTTHDNLPGTVLTIDNFLNGDLESWLQAPDAIRIGAVRAVVLGVFLALICLPARLRPASPWPSLDSAPGPIIQPAYAGQKVVVRGVVSAPAFHFSAYTMLAIQDGRNGGVLKLPVPDTSLDRYHPGDEMEAEGKVSVQYGMTMLEPERISVSGTGRRRSRRTCPPGNCRATMHLGELVRTQGTGRRNRLQHGRRDDPAAWKSGAIQDVYPARAGRGHRLPGYDS